MNILDNISDVQRDGIIYIDTPLLLLAGAGSGKTLVITKKIAYLIKEKNIHPEHIMAVTFTNKAANEMKNRVCNILTNIKPYRLFIKTFHSACLKILKENYEYIGYRENFIILDDTDKISIIKQLMKEEDIPKSITVKMISNFISNVKNELEDGITYDREFFERIYHSYLEYSISENVMDFDDLIVNTIKLFENNIEILNYYRNRFKYILVDEFQDTNYLQYKLIKLLSFDSNNICRNNLTVVGDDDQSIYAFRGANVSNILNFEKDFPNTKIIRLEENYRCSKSIVDVALSVIQNNSHRHTKNVFSNIKDEYSIENWVCYSDLDEAKSVVDEIERLFCDGFEAKDIVILFRTNSQSRAYEKELLAHSINYIVVGALEFYKRIEIKDSISFLRLLTGFEDNFSFRRTINTPPRGIGEKTLSNIEDFSNKKNITLYKAIDFIDECKLTKKVINALKYFKYIIEEYKNKIKDDIDNNSGIEIENIFFEFLLDIDYFSIFSSEEERRTIVAKENIKELFRAFYNYRALENNSDIINFLEEISLYRDISNNSDNNNDDSITLMTVHNAKGLEFDVVFITGLEQGVFPHYFSLEEENGIDEERRLFYVAITRAKKKLYLTYSKKRRINTGILEQLPSPFLFEIPKHLLDKKEKNNYRYDNFIDIDEDAFIY